MLEVGIETGMKNAGQYDDDVFVLRYCVVEFSFAWHDIRVDLMAIGRRERVRLVIKESKMANIRRCIRPKDNILCF